MKQTEKIKVAIMFGGMSEEYQVSIKSARQVAQHLDLEKYQPFYIGVTPLGAWKLCEMPCLDWEKTAGASVMLSPNRGLKGLFLFQEGSYEIQPIDVIFPLIHGKMGEDGTLQGLLALSGIPYVGCDLQASILCMDKSLAYLAVAKEGIKTPRFFVVNQKESLEDGVVQYPVFVKPARSGSSFGVTKAYNEQQLQEGIEIARQYDSKVLIEEAILGMEVGCAILGNGGDLFVGEVDQIKMDHGFFRIHQEETPEAGSENASFMVPAALPKEKRGEIQAVAKGIYEAIGCRGLARVDLFLQEDGEILLNEINTMPGFTSYSRYPRMMEAGGISMGALIDRCITLARGAVSL